MQFLNEAWAQIAIFVLAVCGFFVARHIYNHKKAKRPLICPIGFDCNFVVHSDYSEFMHIPLEIFGMIYYIFLSFSYLYLISLADTASFIFSGLLVLSSFGAFVFSLYLLGVQLFILKKGCSWCIISSFISAAIFVLIVFSQNFGAVLQNFVT